MNATQIRLSIMMFLQFFLWGSWFTTLAVCLGKDFSGGMIADSYGAVPIAAIISPLFLGLIADRFFPSQVVMGVLLLIGGIFLLMVPGYAADPENGKIIVWLLLGHLLCYMPTLGLGNSITFANVKDQNDFPKIRVWGTIGWIAAGLFVGYKGWSADFRMFTLGGGCSILLGLYSFTLPHTPAPAKGKPISMRSLLMLDAFAMLKDWSFMIFIVCSTLVCVPLAYYYVYTSSILSQVGFNQPASTMALGQMSEIIFMLLIPFFFRRLGVKKMIMVGMAAWVVRYLLFAYGAPDQAIWMILLAVILHGICYDFFFVTGFMYTDKKAPVEIRGQAQSMLVFFTQGIGMFFGYKIAGMFNLNTMTKSGELGKAIEALKPVQDLGFFEKFGQMFSYKLPEGLDATLLSETMAQWKEFWIVPAIMAAVVLVIFAIFFHDKSDAAFDTSNDEA